jgi:hypothetical protein
LPAVSPDGTVCNEVTVPPPDGDYFPSGAITTQTRDRKTTWLPAVSLDGTVRNEVSVPPPDGDFSLRRHYHPNS